MALRDAEQSQKLLLQRLFPKVKAAAIKKVQKHNDWLEEFAGLTNQWLAEELAQKLAQNAPKKADKSQSKPQENEEQLQKLEGQVKHYKSVLAETVSIIYDKKVL